mgnify:CR=1 FL=1
MADYRMDADAPALAMDRGVQGVLGKPRRFESRFERWRPEAAATWRESAAPEDAGGVLFDLGPHLIDQALLLFGLFAVQFAVPNTEFRLFMSGVYLVLAVGIFIRNRREAVDLVRHARTAHLEETEG